MSLKKVSQVAFAIGVCELAGILGSVFTTSSIPTWYAALQKPELRPPNWVFAPVWTMLYALMGIAAFLIWRKGFNKKSVKVALGVFGVQLVLNVLWSVLFFGLHNPFAAFVEILLLWLAIFWTIILFYKLSRAAAYLLIPYFVWVSFAAYLNFAIWRLNS